MPTGEVAASGAVLIDEESSIFCESSVVVDEPVEVEGAVFIDEPVFTEEPEPDGVEVLLEV